jgi:hypothetical protein
MNRVLKRGSRQGITYLVNFPLKNSFHFPPLLGVVYLPLSIQELKSRDLEIAKAIFRAEQCQTKYCCNYYQ